MKLISKRDMRRTRDDGQKKAQVISELGENLGVMSIDVALDLAESKSLDLATVTDGKSDGITIVKMLDYSKKMYNEKKKRAMAKKACSRTVVKELRMSPRLGYKNAWERESPEGYFWRFKL